MPTVWWLRKMQSAREPHPGNTWEEISGIGVPSGTPRVKTDKYSVVNVPVQPAPSLCGLKNTVSHEGFMATNLWQPINMTSMSSYFIKDNNLSPQYTFIERLVCVDCFNGMFLLPRMFRQLNLSVTFSERPSVLLKPPLILFQSPLLFIFTAFIEICNQILTDIKDLFKMSIGLPWWSSGKESALQCRGRGFDPWSGK